jgi:hypothetical protein
MGLCDNVSEYAQMYFLSLYGSPQQVKAIFSLLASGRKIELIRDESRIGLERKWGCGLRFKGITLGYGKRHGLVWTESISKNIIFWTSPEEKMKVLRSAIAKRRIPLEKAWLPEVEQLLLKKEYLIELSGWGGAGGYECRWQDDAVCDLIAEEIMKKDKENDRNN